MPQQNQIQFTTGSETVKDGSCKVYAFFVPRLPDQRGAVETFLSKTAKDPSHVSGIRVSGAATFVPAVDGVLEESGGRWVTQRYVVPDGEVVKLFAQKKASWSSPIKSASMLIRSRSTGPLRKLKISTLGLQQCRLPEVEIVGRFDILTLAEAKLIGVVIGEQFEHQFADVNTEGLFEDEVMEPELERRQEVRIKAVPAATGAIPQVVVVPEGPVHRRKLEMD